MNAALLSIVLAGGWWPFTGAPTYEPEFTVGNLPNSQVQATPSGMDHVTVEAAMEQYRRVLDLPLSFALDTALFPLTGTWTLVECSAEDEDPDD